MNFREAIKRLAFVVAGLSAVGAVTVGVAVAPSRANIANLHLYSVALEDAGQMKSTASEVLRYYRANLGSSDEGILQRICAAESPEHVATCNEYAEDYKGFWKRIGLHALGTLAAALGAALAVLIAWKLLDWILAGFSVDRSKTAN